MAPGPPSRFRDSRPTDLFRRCSSRAHLAARSSGNAAFEDEPDDEQHHEDDEEDLRDAGRRARQSGEP